MKHGLSMVLALIPAALCAQNFEHYVTEIIANNPTLEADRAASRAEVMARVAENRLGATEIGFDRLWPQTSAERPKTGVEVSQGFDWPGAYAARNRATRRAKAALGARLHANERATALNARTLLCTLVNANLRCDLLEKMVCNLDSLHSAMHKMLSAGEVTELNHRRAAIEEVAMRQQLVEAENTRTSTLSAIAALNGGTLPADVAELREYPAQELKPLEHYLAIADPEAAALADEASSKLLDAKAEKMGLLPGFSIGYAFEREDEFNFHGFKLGLRLPEYSAKAKAEAARWQARALELQADQAAMQRRAEVTAAHKEAQSTAELLHDYGKAFGADYPGMLKRSLNGGQITYTEYFSELNFYMTSRLDYLDRLLGYNMLLMQLSR